MSTYPLRSDVFRRRTLESALSQRSQHDTLRLKAQLLWGFKWFNLRSIKITWPRPRGQADAKKRALLQERVGFGTLDVAGSSNRQECLYTSLCVQLDEFGHNGLLRVEAVFGLVEDDALWAIEHVLADFFAGVGGQAVHEVGVGLGEC